MDCNMIPNNRDGIPTPAAAHGPRHLRSIAQEIPPVNPSAQILLLLGRDILSVHKVRRQISGPHEAAYAQKLDLGWFIVGDVCLGSTHKPTEVTSMKTHILETGRPSHFPACENHLTDKKKPGLTYTPKENLPNTSSDNLGRSFFHQTTNDNKLVQSMEVLFFLKTKEK